MMFQWRSPLAGRDATWVQFPLVASWTLLFPSPGACLWSILILVSLTSLSKVAMIQAPRPSPLLAQAEPALPIFSTLSKAFLQDQLGAREEEEVQVMALGFTFLGAWQSEVLVWVEGVEVSATACTSSMATGVPAVVVCWARIWDQVSGACRPPAQLTSAR